MRNHQRTTSRPVHRNAWPRFNPAGAVTAGASVLAVALLWGALLLGALGGGPVGAAEAVGQPERVREIFVPYEDLQVLIEGNAQQVFLTRQEYQELLAKAKKTPPDEPAPAAALWLAADYEGTIEEGRLRLRGAIDLEVLNDGLHALPLELDGVGLRRAALGERSAAIGRNDQGQTVLFVEGVGRQRLLLELVAPLQTSAAQQAVAFRLPTPPAARLRLTVPGNVEVKSGAKVLRRDLDEAASVTRFELLLPREPVSLVLSLNNRMLRQQRVVVARSVLVDEITSAYERLHTTVSLDVLHGAADHFRLVLPAGFEPTEVLSPLLARWAVAEADGQRVLEVVLREPATGTVVLNVSATRTPAQLDDWAMPQLVPLDVAGQVAVVGLVVEDQLAPEGIEFQGLIPVDNGVLTAALPETVFRAEPGAPRIRPVATYYAPQADFALQARFRQPPPRLQVTANVLLVLDDQGHHVRGGFALLPQVEKLFAVRFTAPAGWNVTQVTAADGQPLAVERYEAPPGGALIHVRLPQGLPPGEVTSITFQAEHVPPDWLGPWPQRTVALPRFAVEQATRDTGAVAIRADDDLVVRPGELTGLDPLDENEKEKYGLAGVESNLAYRYEAPGYALQMTVTRAQPTIAARSFCFLRIAPEGLTAHYEILYDIRQARVRQLRLRLPPQTPSSLAIRGAEGAVVKEFSSEETEDGRCWTALLAEPASGVVRLAVDFQQPLPDEDLQAFALPLARADEVAYQSAVVAVEGSADLDIDVKTQARAVDVGELVAAQYRVGTRLLGAYEFVGPSQEVRVDVTRRPGYGLPPAIVQRAELVTVLSAAGVGQTAARYQLRTQAAFLEVRLPPRSVLWSALLDGQPVAPQQDGDRLLLDLPASGGGSLRDVQIVYETAVSPVVMLNRVAAEAPTLWLRSDREGRAGEVPTADVTWKLLLPEGHRLVRSDGTVYTELPPPRTPLGGAMAGMYYAAGGTPGLLMARAGAEAAFRAREASRRVSGLGLDAPQSAPAGGPVLSDESVELWDLQSDAFEAAQPTAESMPEAAEEAPPAPAEVAAGEEREQSQTRSPADQPVARPEMPRLESAVAEPAVRPRRDARHWALEGLRSLPIALQQQGEEITFQSLGERPQLSVTIANARRFDLLAWAVGLAVFAAGLLLSRRAARTRIRYVVVVAVAALALPLATGLTGELSSTCDAAFYAACCVAAWYMLAAAAHWLVPHVAESLRDPHPVSEKPGHVEPGHVPPPKLPSLLLVVALAAAIAGTAAAQAPQPPAFDPSGLIELLAPTKPIRLPADAVIIPYDADRGTEGLTVADRVVVPYKKYVELWNRAFPDQKKEVQPPITAWSLAGAAYEATLAGEDFLLVTGRVEIDVFSDQPVGVPLRLAGGVLASATIDGAPARLQLIQAASPPNPQQQQVAQVEPAPDADFALLHVTGPGRRQLALQIRLKLERRGGWRLAAGRLPAAAATSLTLTVPAARTEVRLAGLADRSEYETAADDEQIATALGVEGTLQLQWRPKVAEGQVDRSLTVASEAVLDVQEDGLRLIWQLELQFPRSRRDRFEVLVPADYLVERVVGENVRSWELKAAEARQRLSITLLKEAVDRERVTLALSRRGAVAADRATSFSAPAILVDGAVLHKGRLTIRRSPQLELRATRLAGLARTDLAAEAVQALAAAGVAEESPLGLRPYQAFEFGAIAFALELEAAPVSADAAATLHSLLRIADRELRLETQVHIDVRTRPVHRLRVDVPEALEIEHIAAPGEFTWALTGEGGRRLLCVYLGAGQAQPFAVVIRGTLGRRQAADPVEAPALQVLDVARQQGELVVQVDPAFDVRAAGLQNCETILLSHVFGWLHADQRPLARLALRHGESPYAARLEVLARRPRVSGATITNVKVTDVAVEETISIDLTIHDAGIREVEFTLPAGMEQARVNAPMLRQKTVQQAAEGRARFRLELQDDILGQYRILIENDRVLLAANRQESAEQTAPIPELLTGRTDQRYVTLENAGRDEVQVVDQLGLVPLGRQQSEWRRLAAVLGESLTSAYIVQPDTPDPRLTFKTRQRSTVETARASIGLGETLLVVDASGAYRGQQTYQVHNTIEQFLVIRLPTAAQLWTATVAGQPVKPTEVPGGTSPDQVRIPLIKTAEGDRDYAVVLKYGGRLQPVGTVDRLSFPLLRTVNIQVELSRVRLRLPQTHTWFDFGGTLRQVFDEGSFEADFFSYNAKQAKRLLQAMNTDNPYARARSMSNLKQLGLGLQSYSGEYDSLMRNEAFKRNFDANADLIRQAEQQTQELLIQEDQAIITDNRARLNTFFLDQKNNSARNVVTELGGNFQVLAEGDEAPSAADKERFNYRWLESNQLQNRVQISQDGVELRFGKQAQVQAVDKLQGYAQNQSLLGDLSGEAAAQFRNRRGGEAAERESAAVGQSQQALARQYQRKLEEEQLGQAPQKPAQEQDVSSLARDGGSISGRLQRGLAAMPPGSMYGSSGMPGGDAPDGMGMGMGGMGGGYFGADHAAGSGPAMPGVAGPVAAPEPQQPDAAGAAYAVETHYASLDVELAQRGREYLFTTPRGDIEITARAVSAPLLGRLLRLLALAVGAVVLVVALRVAARVLPTLHRNRWLVAGVLLAGLLSLLLGLFPLLGLAAMVYGLVQLIRLEIARRRALALA